MASLSAIPASVSTLSEQLCSEIGGAFHPNNAERNYRYPKNRADDEGYNLKGWIKRSVKDNTDSLDNCFDIAIRKWVAEKIEELSSHKKFHSEMMGYAAAESGLPSYRTLNMVINDLRSIEMSFPPLVSSKQDNEKDEDFVIVDDELADQLAVLDEWKQQPSRVLETFPRIKAAFEYLKNNPS